MRKLGLDFSHRRVTRRTNLRSQTSFEAHSAQVLVELATEFFPKNMAGIKITPVNRCYMLEKTDLCSLAQKPMFILRVGFQHL
jgi:hypothetical protein